MEQRYAEAASKIAGIQSLMTEEERQFLFAFAWEHGGSRIVEVGAFKGASTILLCLAAPQAKVTSFDIFKHHSEPSAELLQKNLRNAGVTNHELIVQNTLQAKWSEPIDLLFIDGDHGYGHVINELRVFAVHSSWVLMHDIEREGVARAAREFYDKQWTVMPHLPHLGAWRRDWE
jgi:predicted O-methyltransferase YrrM